MNITVHPDTYYAKYAGTQVTAISDVSEDVITLGKQGAEVIAQVDPVLQSYNQCVTELQPKYQREYSRARGILYLLNLKSPQMRTQYDKLNATFRTIDRVDIEIYIREHPDMTADEICSILRDNESWLRRHANSFIRATKKTAARLTDILLNPSDREEILKKYRTITKKLNQHPLKNFINTIIAHRPDTWVPYTKTDHVYWRFVGTNLTDAMYHIAWLIETNGFTSISTLGMRRYTFTNIEDFVVAMYHSMSQKSKYHDFKIMVTINRPLMAEFDNAEELSSTIQSTTKVYQNAEFKYAPDITKLYDGYTVAMKNALEATPTNVSPAQYISDMIHYITDESHKVSTRIYALNEAYKRNRAAQIATIRSASVVDDASPYDYETGVRNAIDKITSSTYCINNGKSVLYTHFSYTDDTKDDGVGMCLVMYALRNYIDSVCFTSNSKRIECTTKCYDVLYKVLRSSEYGHSFKIPGMIYWKTDNVFDFTKPLQKAFDFL